MARKGRGQSAEAQSNLTNQTLRPQKGPQEKFLSTPADIAIYGGAAGGGKTYALLLECLRHMGNPKFGAVVFRSQAVQVMNEGGLYDAAQRMYLPLGAVMRRVPMPTVVWPSGSKITFAHITRDEEAAAWQGSELPLICYDELTHFSEYIFWYMLSRNRTTCGVKPYIRATCNPDADSWVAKLIAWWIDQKTGYPIPERSGKLRYFIRLNGEIKWGRSANELVKRYKVKPEIVKSLTFISANLEDNKILMASDPGYFASLNALDTVTRERLLCGNWKIKPSAGLYFKREQTRIVDEPPDKIVDTVRAWDLAATEITESNRDPDRTAGCLMGRMKNGQYIILDAIQKAASASAVRSLVTSAAASDRAKYNTTRIIIPQDPGQAGKEQAQSYTRELAGYAITSRPVSGSKIKRAEPFAAQWQAGNVLLLRAPWNDTLLLELETFPDGAHDDQVDAASDAFGAISRKNADWSALIS